MRRPRHGRPTAGREVVAVLSRAAAPVLLGLAFATLLVLTVAALGREDGAAQARPADAATSGAPAPATDPRDDASAPRSRPVELLQVLVDERSAAWRAADPARLGAADAPGSPASTRDAAALAELVRSGVRYSGLRHTVVEATTLEVSQERAVVRARVDAGAYTVVEHPASVSGSSRADRLLESRAPLAGAPVLVHLVRTGAGWRIDDVAAVP